MALLSRQEIKNFLIDRNVVEELTPTQIETAIDAATREFIKLTPIIMEGSFSTIPGQQLYDIFSRLSPSPPELVNQKGLQVIETIWSPSSLDSAIDVFSPFYANYNITGSVSRISGDSFSSPSDYKIFANNLQQWRETFAGSGEQVSNEIGSPLRLYPKPQNVGNVYLVYTAPRLAEDYKADAETSYLLFVEAQCCDMLARYYAREGGVTFSTFRDNGYTAEYFKKEAERLRRTAKQDIETLGYDVLSAISRT